MKKIVLTMLMLLMVSTTYAQSFNEGLNFKIKQPVIVLSIEQSLTSEIKILENEIKILETDLLSINKNFSLPVINQITSPVPELPEYVMMVFGLIMTLLYIKRKTI
jgi:hypothetical protein